MAPSNNDLIILDIEDGKTQQKDDTVFEILTKFLSRKGSIKLRQKVIFFRMMATLINASLTVTKSLQALRKQEKDKTMQKFYDYMLEKVQS